MSLAKRDGGHCSDCAELFVRHAYFTGSQEPYDKLKRALRAEIDEAAWSSLYSTESAPSTCPPLARSPSK